MFKTVTRTADKPRQGLVMNHDGTLIGSMDLDLFRASSGHGLQSSLIEAMEQSQQQKEPTIEVKMKHRTKNAPSDDFKFVVNYEVELSKEDQKNLENQVPSTPSAAKLKRDEEASGQKTIGVFQNGKNGDYNMLAGQDSEASIVIMEDDNPEKEDKNKKVAINLNKNFD